MWPSQIKKLVELVARAERSNEPSTTARQQRQRQTPPRSHQQKSLTVFLLDKKRPIHSTAPLFIGISATTLDPSTLTHMCTMHCTALGPFELSRTVILRRQWLHKRRFRSQRSYTKANLNYKALPLNGLRIK